ncbi:MAG: ATP-binding protein [Deltaproteobacteria bacterium]|nr:ATP-binding protein [Deltaproteobacteria bacterium]
MKYLGRTLQIDKLLKSKSFFLLGPRSTGKTTLIRHQLPKARIYDLLDHRTFSRLVKNPLLLEEENRNTQSPIVIDEIQKLPGLLDEVQRQIAQSGRRFLLTGSSARKLKRGVANLLAGRAWMAELFPLTFEEIPDFDLIRYLNRGGLPQVYFSPNAAEELESYISLYLKEEVQAESLTRNLSSFAGFLDAIALSNGEEINLESFGRDCGVSPLTVKNYIQILADTLIGFPLPGFTKTKKRKAISRIKHYLFDIGVVNSLTNRGEIKAKSELFGKAFEQFIVQELRAYLSYSRSRESLSYWRSTSLFEVDLLVGQELAIEIKATAQVNDGHLKGLRALKEEGLIRRFAIVSLDEESRRTSDGIDIYPWRVLLKKLWGGALLAKS